MIKKYFYLLIPIGLLLGSCSNKAKQETVDAMADEMCHAMSLIDEADPMSILEAHSALAKIWEKTEEYGKVTEAQLQESMNSKCSDGLKKYLNMVAEEEEE